MALSSCAMLGVGTFNVAYDHADWLLQRMASRYVDFDAGQARVMHTGFSNLHAWHRGRELPLYADMMESAATRIEHGLKHEDVIWMMGAVNERWRAVSDRLAQTATPVLATLSAEQVAHMERKLADDNAKFAKTQASADLNKADRYRAEWLIDQLQRWTGALTAVQKARVELAVKQTEDFPPLRLAERRRRQANFLRLVRTTRDPQILGRALNEMLIAPREGADEAYRSSVAHYEDQMIHMLLDIDRTLSLEQRATAAARMRRYAQSFRQLALQKDAPGGGQASFGEEAIELDK